jgi:hypothetical protein
MTLIFKEFAEQGKTHRYDGAETHGSNSFRLQAIGATLAYARPPSMAWSHACGKGLHRNRLEVEAFVRPGASKRHAD